MARTIKNYFFLLLCLIGARLWADESDDKAETLLRGTLAPPTAAYEGTLTVTHWFGDQVRTEDVRVSFSPPDHYRREFLNPDGSVARVCVSDGQVETIHFLKRNHALKGGAVKHAPRQMPLDQEWALLRENYRIALVQSDPVAGRPIWFVRVQPLVDGKLVQELSIDRQTGVVLENKRYRPQGTYVVRSRFHTFRPTQTLPADLFVIVLGNEPEDHEFAPDFLSREDWSKHTGRTTHLPASLPRGFVFESADFFLVDGKPVDHFRYTDGLSVISVFQTKARLKTNSMSDTDENGHALALTRGNEHYMLMGDTSTELLREMGAVLH